MLNKTASAIGNRVMLKTSEWEGNQTAADNADKAASCLVHSHRLQCGAQIRQWQRGRCLHEEMGINGEGLLETDEALPFAMKYPYPFIGHYYKSNPDELPEHLREETIVQIDDDDDSAEDEERRVPASKVRWPARPMPCAAPPG